jgi:hypothetical protein
MSKTVLANVDGFTPCIDNITQEYGIMVSAVFGRVWRYCQGERGICDASLETIAEDLRMGYMTVLRHVKLLVNEGLLEDLTPNLRYKPHTYRDTGKVHFLLSMSAGLPKREIGSTNLVDEGLPKRELKIDSKKPIKKEKEQDPRTQHPAILAVRDITGRYPTKDVYDVLIASIGGEPDARKLKACFEAWRVKDYKPTNYGWVTDWYKNGIPVFQKNGNGKFPPAAQPPSASPEELERQRELDKERTRARIRAAKEKQAHP